MRVLRAFAGSEADAAGNQLGHLARAEVRGHDDHAFREVYPAIIAKGQCSFIENAQQQLPQRVGSLFDFVEQHQSQLNVVGMRPIEIFLRQHRRSFAVAEISRR